MAGASGLEPTDGERGLGSNPQLAAGNGAGNHVGRRGKGIANGVSEEEAELKEEGQCRLAMIRIRRVSRPW